MTKMQSAVAHRFIDRAPVKGDIVTVTPLGERLFEVIALDDVYGEMIWASPIDSDQPTQWHFLTHVKVVDDESSDLDCHCGHPECGAC